MKDLNKLNDVARHSVSGYGRQDISYNDPDGDFVFYSDYKSLEQRAEAAERENDKLKRIQKINLETRKVIRDRFLRAERERDELKDKLGIMDGRISACRAMKEHWKNRAWDAEEEIERRDADSQDPACYIHESQLPRIKNEHGLQAWLHCSDKKDGDMPLYTAAPPAVLPPEKEVPPFLTHQAGKAIGWNDCIAEAIKLGAQTQKPVVLPHRRLATVVKGHALKTYPLSFFDPDEVIAMLDAANVTYEVKK